MNTDSHHVTLIKAVLPEWMRLLSICQNQSEEVTAELLANFDHLVAIARGKENGSAADTGAIIEKMRSGFQYQDRQSQMLAILLADLQLFLDSAQQGSITHDGDAWLKRLKSTYVVPELVDAQKCNGATALPVAHGDETTFF